MKKWQKPKKLIKKYSTAIIEGLDKKIKASSSLNHKLTKGELRELFVSSILSSFLTNQFDSGTGIVINQKEEQSNQTDIILYDNRILPPFIKQQHIGIYPAESVLGTIEVKSNLDKSALLKAEEDAKYLHETIFNPGSSIYNDYGDIKPKSGVIGFYGRGPKELMNQEDGAIWLSNNIRYLFAICILGKVSWLNLQGKGWAISESNKDFEETKRFIAVYLDNLRTTSETRINFLGQFAHKDWLSVYIREQNLFDS
ncbi:MAG: DUF6602 domain-containing protein [Candidatus Hodarchaeales archaeon]|jgi:hypothetical protein